LEEGILHGTGIVVNVHLLIQSQSQRRSLALMAVAAPPVLSDLIDSLKNRFPLPKRTLTTRPARGREVKRSHDESDAV
jgi:hypothetical protein